MRVETCPGKRHREHIAAYTALDSSSKRRIGANPFRVTGERAMDEVQYTIWLVRCHYRFLHVFAIFSPQDAPNVYEGS